MVSLFEETLVFEANTEGYPRYRIPSLIQAPNGDLLAFAEGRVLGDHDDVDIVMKRSTDNGQTWSNLQVIYGDQFTDGTTIGNPNPVVDETTGTIWLPVIQDQFEVLLFNSTDNGNTWSGPVNISDQVKNPAFPFGPEPTNSAEERIIWTGPGTGIQIQNGPNAGRLVIPAHFQPFPDGPDAEGAGVENNEMWVFYSDDNGQTWSSGDSSVLGNEPQVVELSNQDLLLNGRNQNQRFPVNQQIFRWIATSSDGGDNFTNSVLDDELIDPVVQASLFRYSFGSGEDNIIVFANPIGNPDGDPPNFRSRENLTVRLSNDDGQNWNIDRLVNPEFSAYSSLARQSNDNIGLLYEGLSSDSDPSLQPGFHNITFASFNLEWLTEASTNPPDAVDDSFDNIPENSTDNVLDVLANDSDLDGDILTIIDVGVTSNGGTVTINETSDGLLYTPASGFVGTETFNYTLSDNSELDLTDEATVTVTVTSDVINSAPEPEDDFFDNIERSSSSNVLDVLANDSDPDGDPLTILEVGTTSAGGIVEINSEGDGLIYSPTPAFVGEETFTYTVSDGRGGDVQANVTVNVEEEEDASIFLTDWDNLNGWNQNGTDISIVPDDMLRLFDNADTTTQVFRSDIDIPNTYALEFTAQVDQFTANNKVSLGAKIQDGNFRLMFQRRADGFYVIDDTNTWTQLRSTSEFIESADYRIEVNNGVGSLFAKASGNDLFTFVGDWNLQTNQQGDRLEHWVRGLPSDPAEARIDSTRILELDPIGDFNNEPVAENDLFDIEQNSVDNVLNVLNNDSDPDDDILTILSVEEPNNGEVFINSTQDGLVYTPAAGFVGQETFNYTIVDSRGGADQAEVTVTVNDDNSGAPILLTNWEDLEGWNTSGAESASDISITQTGELRLFDNADTTTRVFRSDVDITGAYSIQFQVQVDRYTTDNKVSLGVKVQDGNFRLMFQRRPDGYYVIDNSNTWVQLPDPDGNFQPEFTESREYQIDVDNGIGVLSSRAGAADNFVVDGQWNLQPFQQGDLVEHWVRGTIENPAEARFDMTEIF